MARQTLQFEDQGQKVEVEIRNPGNTYITISTHYEAMGDFPQEICLRLKTLRKIVDKINKSGWGRDD
jgi:hypothetical protein